MEFKVNSKELEKHLNRVIPAIPSRTPMPILENFLFDIKDGLLRMILFTNLENVEIRGKRYNPIPVLKLTTAKKFKLTNSNSKLIHLLLKEAHTNGFKLMINGKFIN